MKTEKVNKTTRRVLGDFELQMLDVSTCVLYSIICKLIM